VDCAVRHVACLVLNLRAGEEGAVHILPTVNLQVSVSSSVCRLERARVVTLLKIFAMEKEPIQAHSPSYTRSKTHTIAAIVYPLWSLKRDGRPVLTSANSISTA
jgi:hypothetical protein